MIPRIRQHHCLVRLLGQACGSGSGSVAVGAFPLRAFQTAAPRQQSNEPAPAIRSQCYPRPFSTSRPRHQVPRPPPQEQPSEPLPSTPSTPSASDSDSDSAPAAPSTQTPAAEPKPAPKPKSNYRLISAAIFLLLGSLGGTSLRVLIAPPEPPIPGSEADGYTIELLHEQAEKLPIVKQLTADPAWQSWDAYNTLSAEHKAQHIAAGALAGSRGFGGFQRVFYNPQTGELISVIFFGAAIVGWPGVVHGGALATLLDESCGRAAFKQWGGLSGMTASLKLQYVKATLSNGFYVLRVKPRSEDELDESERGKRHYKALVDATIEDAVTGRTTVIAEALFVGGHGKNGLGKLKLAGKDENLQF
ncbi:HotDog domain-containing protein [Podospora appendiculata]|uniref:HotDog domain-containing protein n=1 Tax=Podospora appendiculata TaxID=314037 RepID=A0AAE0XHS4_9PEZI|nr:HotDog domain-containing protein [Podospora appendiculata]